MDLQENVVVADRYRLVRMIGRGGMGSVWQAVHIALDQPCAVKFIEGEMANYAEAHARFEREAKAAAALRSPHVVQIFDHGVWEGRPYIAMEMLEGEDLGKALARAGGKISPAELLPIVEQICRALTRAHAAGFVHRDLKPDNVFLVHDDDRLLVKILDFGVAKQTSHAVEGSNTRTGAMLGTPYYMSPEQAQGIKSVDARSDLWSLAVIVFQCLTGRLPFESEALGDLLVKIIVQPVPVPSQLGPVPPGFDAWWARAADRDPERRFPTAKELAASLAMAFGTTSSLDPSGSMPRGGSTLMVVGAPSRPMAATGPRTPPPGGAPAPPFAATPAPASAPFAPAPPFAATPAPGSAPFSAAAPLPAYAQPTPNGMVLSGSQPGFVEAPPAAPARRGSGLAVAAVGFALLGLAGVGGLLAYKSRKPVAVVAPSAAASHPAISGEAPPPSAVAADAPPASGSATTTGVALPASAASATEPPPPSSAARPPRPAAEHHPTGTTGATAVAVTAPAPVPSAKPTAAAPAPATSKGWNAGF